MVHVDLFETPTFSISLSPWSCQGKVLQVAKGSTALNINKFSIKQTHFSSMYDSLYFSKVRLLRLLNVIWCFTQTHLTLLWFLTHESQISWLLQQTLIAKSQKPPTPMPVIPFPLLFLLFSLLTLSSILILWKDTITSIDYTFWPIIFISTLGRPILNTCTNF